MKVKKIHIENYRMLKRIDIDLEENLSLIIGKNNCGKTSFLSILNKFIGSQSSTNNFTYNDFNSDFQDSLFDATENKEGDNTLSSLSNRYYEKTKDDESNPTVANFEDTLHSTDKALSGVYDGLFEKVIKKVKKFGGIRENETVVKSNVIGIDQ